MCGICGSYFLDSAFEVHQSALKRMNDELVHRGPDEEGFFVNGNVGFGHKRLSIIDLSEGQQPMRISRGDEELVITYNGEIYNYIEIREELIKLGYKFRTNSDTEVILNSYLEWGEQCVEHFNGMWAFAIWKKSDNSLFLSRDRMGEKPLYYFSDSDGIHFSSELPSLLKSGISVTPNFEILNLYLLLCYVPAPYTFYKNISILEAGHNILVKNGKIEIKKYWDLPEIDNESTLRNKDEVYEQFDFLFKDSVKLRMRSDVPFGAFLSGGLDSSSIVSIMDQFSDHRVKTFSIGFDEKEFDERDLAKLVSKKYNTEHYEKVVHPDSYDTSLANVVKHYGDPFGDSSAIPTGIVSSFAAEKVKMVLTGDGGDEVLSGYTTYQGEKFASAYQRVPSLVGKNLPRILSKGSSFLKGGFKYKANRATNVLHSSSLPFADRLKNKAGQIDPVLIDKLVLPKSGNITFHDFYQQRFKYLDAELNNFYRLMYWHLKVSLPDDMLRKVDRMSMSHSLETRIPFLDHRLISMMINVDHSIKMEGYERKSVLRHTIAKNLPAQLLKSGKKGFRVPVREWFKKESLLKSIRNLGELENFIDGKKWREILESNQSGKLDAGNFIWTVAVLKKWSEDL
ncbi:MAG: asparagine synthase (glutamine-hydrolyzing) [Ekhidna sp.]